MVLLTMIYLLYLAYLIGMHYNMVMGIILFNSQNLEIFWKMAGHIYVMCYAVIPEPTRLYK